MKELVVDLVAVGVPQNEARAYLELRRRGPLSANALAQFLGMDRTLAYQVLNKLSARGLANHDVRGRTRLFAACDPENLLRPIREREARLKTIVPKLRSLAPIVENPQDVRVYEGKNGLRAFLREISAQRDLCVFGATGQSFDALRYDLPHLVSSTRAAGMRGRMIASGDARLRALARVPGFALRTLPRVTSPVTTTIGADVVCIHVVGERPTVVVIRNRQVAKGYREYFEILWRFAKPVASR